LFKSSSDSTSSSEVVFEKSLSQQLLRLDRKTLATRTPAELLTLLKDIDDQRVMIIEDSVDYGKLAFCKLSQHDILVKTTEAPHDNLIKYAAKLARNQSLSLNGKIRVRIARVENVLERDGENGISFNLNDIVFDKMISFAVCCLLPVLPDEDIFIDHCNKCNNVIHLDCLAQNSTIFLTCEVCAQTNSGIEWGAGMKNTCPLDSPLQIVLLKSLDDEKLAELMKMTSYGNKAMGPLLELTIRNAKQENWAAIHQAWAKIIGIEGNSLYGSTYEVFWKNCKEGGLVSCKIWCSECFHEGINHFVKYLRIQLL